MDQRALVVQLQAPFADYCGDDAAAHDAILAGLSWPMDTPRGYWQGLAVDWIEQGATVDAEMAELLDVIAITEKLPQDLRHKSRAIVQQWLSKTHGSAMTVSGQKLPVKLGNL